MPSVTLRLWCQADAEFVVKVRNHPELQRWFRQDRDLTLQEQRSFIANHPYHRGYIIEAGGVPAGVAYLVGPYEAKELEFGIGLLPEFQGKGIAKQAMDLLCKLGFWQLGAKKIFSDVFVTNPALPFYLWKCGFKAVGVKERMYFKKDYGMIDVVLIEREAE